MSLYVVDSDIVQGVVEHMNDDHSDACLVIVRALGNQPNATHATMQWMDAEGADFQVSNECRPFRKKNFAFNNYAGPAESLPI